MCKSYDKLNIDKTKNYIFCSITCACYSGCFNIKTGLNKKKCKEFNEQWKIGRVVTQLPAKEYTVNSGA